MSKAWLWTILALALVARLFFFPGYHEIWWDSGVYVGMGKYIWSGGAAGLWETIRPIAWPFVLGMLWTLKLDPLIFGGLLEILLSIGILFFVYFITREWFDPKTAAFTTAILAFSSIFFFLTFHLYTEIPAIFLVVAGIYLFQRHAFYWAGLALGIAFLTKFPTFIFLLALAALPLFEKRWRVLYQLAAGFAIPVTLYLLWNWILYNNPFESLLLAHETILRVVGCNVLRYKPWWHYFDLLWTSENSLHIFSLLGLVITFRKFQRKHVPPLLCCILPLAYFVQLHCRDYRYLILFLPFITMYTARGLTSITTFFKRKHLFLILMIAVLGVSSWYGILFYKENEVTTIDPAAHGYFSYLQDTYSEKEIWSSNPIVAVYTDQPVHKIYYPVYDENVSMTFNRYLSENADRIGYVFLDSCGGGIICHPDDVACSEQTEKMRLFLESHYQKVYEASNACWYVIYARA